MDSSCAVPNEDESAKAERAFNRMVPAQHISSLGSIINSAWGLIENRGDELDGPNRRELLYNLTLKSIELMEIETRSLDNMRETK